MCIRKWKNTCGRGLRDLICGFSVPVYWFACLQVSRFTCLQVCVPKPRKQGNWEAWKQGLSVPRPTGRAVASPGDWLSRRDYIVRFPAWYIMQKMLKKKPKVRRKPTVQLSPMEHMSVRSTREMLRESGLKMTRITKKYWSALKTLS
jgi:hypothetical protein